MNLFCVVISEVSVWLQRSVRVIFDLKAYLSSWVYSSIPLWYREN